MHLNSSDHSVVEEFHVVETLKWLFEIEILWEIFILSWLLETNMVNLEDAKLVSSLFPSLMPIFCLESVTHFFHLLNS